MTLDYFYGQTGELFSFYRIPKALFQEQRFQKRLAVRAEPGVHHLHDRGCQEVIVLRRQQSDEVAAGA